MRAASIWYLFTASTPGLQRFTPMPWTVQLLFFIVPAVNMINQELTIFTAHKTVHMPAHVRSCTQRKHSHLINIHRHAASLTGCWNCKACLNCPWKQQKIISLYEIIYHTKQSSQVMFTYRVSNVMCLLINRLTNKYYFSKRDILWLSQNLRKILLLLVTGSF